MGTVGAAGFFCDLIVTEGIEKSQVQKPGRFLKADEEKLEKRQIQKPGGVQNFNVKKRQLQERGRFLKADFKKKTKEVSQPRNAEGSGTIPPNCSQVKPET